MRKKSAWFLSLALAVGVACVATVASVSSTGLSLSEAQCGDKPCAVGEVTDAVFAKARIKNVEDVRQFERAGIKSPKGVDAFGDRTLPSKPQGSPPRGEAKALTGNAENQRSLMRENEAAEKLASRGYDVERLPDVAGGNGHGRVPTSNPDFLIEGRPFDAYAPSGSDLDNLRDMISTKVKKQTDRLVVVLDDTPVGAEDVTSILHRKPVADLREIIVLDGDEYRRLTPF